MHPLGTLGAFHALLASLVPRAPPDVAARPPPPREILKSWNEPSDSTCATNGFTRWGTFLAAQGLVDDENPVLWSSINIAPLDPQKRLFDTVPDVLNWFAVRTADRAHVEKIHSVVFDPKVRSKFLSGSFIAESLAKANRTDLLQIPWLFLEKSDITRSTAAAVIGLAASDRGQRFLLRRPGDIYELMEDVLDVEARADAVERYRAYINQITLPNSGNSTRTALCMLRVPAGWTMGGRQLIEFFHAYPQPPSGKLITRICAASEVAGAAVQSVLGPAIIRAVERANLAGFFNSVVAHELHTWTLNVETGAFNIRHELDRWKPTRKVRAAVEAHLALVDFDDAIFQRVLGDSLGSRGGRESQAFHPFHWRTSSLGFKICGTPI